MLIELLESGNLLIEPRVLKAELIVRNSTSERR
jgi:hypothetical protein